LSNYGQEEITGDSISTAGIPPGQECEWCGAGSRATHKLPVMRKIKGGGVIASGTFVYCCDGHQEIAEKSNPVRASKR
jgi:hypothetical protein